MKSTTRRKADPVSFRLSSVLDAKLSKLSEAHGMSPGELAAQLVAAALRDEHHLEVVHLLESLQARLADQVNALREDVALTLEMSLLNFSSSKVTPEAVREFVSARMRRRITQVPS